MARVFEQPLFYDLIGPPQLHDKRVGKELTE